MSFLKSCMPLAWSIHRSGHLGIAALLMALSICAHAQVTNYNFAQNSGTFEPIVGGTVLYSGSFDDGISGPITIPAFTYDGVTYTQMYVSTNGFLTLGNTAPSATNYAPLSSSEAYGGAVAPFGANLASAASGSPEIRWRNLGYQVVVQWQDVRRPGQAEAFSFQARLNRWTGVVRMIYGPISAGPSTSILDLPEVGLRGPDNNFSNNVHNRRVGTGVQNWANSLPGNTTDSKMRFTTSAPAKFWIEGLTYRFRNPGGGQGCEPPFVVVIVNTNCANSTFTITADVETIGDANNITVSTIPAGGVYANVGSGVYNFGPYPFGTLVELNVDNNSDADCGEQVTNITNASCDCAGVPDGTNLPGTSCSDGDPCTVDDLWSINCECIGTFLDSDGDGVCNALDDCPTVTGQVGSPCSDGDPCTTGDVLGANCACAGTPVPDTDGDGLCDAVDPCPSGPNPGTACDDGNPCTTGDVIKANCLCQGTPVPDSDGDGLCNTIDPCPFGPNPGQACNDGSPCTINDIILADCRCEGTTVPDSDGDGLCDTIDSCPSVPGGVGSSCNDGNINTINDVLDATCNCVGSLVNCNDNDPCTSDQFDGIQCIHTPLPDGDGDGLCDAIDPCPTGPNPGQACDDGDPCTTTDLVTANCGCAGTPVADTDGDGLCDTVDPCPSGLNPGQACSDGDPCTSGDVVNASCDCVGIPVPDSDGDGLCDAIDPCPAGPNPGQACSDGDPCTTNETVDANCNCVGTPVPDSDNDGLCDAVDPCPAGPNPGQACDDGDPCTSGDTVGQNCACVGTPVPDSDNDDLCDAIDPCPLGLNPGQSCNDGNPCTVGDVIDANCNCIGTPALDSDGDGLCDVVDPCALAATGIPNLDENTCGCAPGYFATLTDINGNDVITACTICPPGSYCPDGTVALPCAAGTFQALAGQISCQDCAAGTFNPSVGSVACQACPAGTFSAVTAATFCQPCQPGFANGSAGQTECSACPSGSYSDLAGAAACSLCPVNTYNPLEAQIECLACPFGETSGLGATACTPAGPCSEVVLRMTTDGNASAQTSWRILVAGTNTVACQNAGPLLNNATEFPYTCCLPDGCYDLEVTDSGADGLVGGGYRLLASNGQRLIDNSQAVAFATSSVSGFTAGVDTGNPYSFCLPIGADRMVHVSCDKYWHKINEFVAANENVAVSAIWNTYPLSSVQRAQSGYEFWVFDPNGSFSYRKFRSHATTDGSGSGSLRACYMRITAVIPELTKLNIKVRGRTFNGTSTTVFPWGPACRFARNEQMALCPPTKLMDIPYNAFYSCGETRIWATNRWLHCRVVSGATQYQWRIRNVAEGYSVIRTTSSYALQLGWTNAAVPALGGTYQVDVRAFVNGQWCMTGDPWGDVCNVTFVAASPVQGGGNENSAMDGEEPRVELIAWPNPTHDVLYISEPVAGQIFDLQGRSVMEVLRTNTIAVGSLVPGVYLLRTKEGNTLRFVRE